MKQATSISSPVVHLVGPGKLKVLNGRLAFTTGQGTPARLDVDHLQAVTCYGDVGITDEAFTVLFRQGVDVTWMSPQGARFRGRLTGLADRSTLLRMLQHRAIADVRGKLELARDVVCDKIRSQLDAAGHYRRHGSQTARRFLRRGNEFLADAERADTVDILRGLEGISSKCWFEVFGSLLKQPWSFPGRVRRPPTDPVNALLSLGYTWLLNRMIAQLQAAGLEVNLGALHDYRPGRPSLACDLIEPLRVPVVDRWVQKLCNCEMLAAGDFDRDQQRGVRLLREAFPRVLGWWEKDWQAKRVAVELDKRIQRFCRRVRELAGGAEEQAAGDG